MSTIAIYERDDLMCGLLREWLTQAGYAVQCAGSCTAVTSRVDLVIASIAMPRVEGDGSISRMRDAHPMAPIIALSSQARSGLSSSGVTARALGVERVMAKPLMRDELLSAVKSALSMGGRQREL